MHPYLFFARSPASRAVESTGVNCKFWHHECSRSSNLSIHKPNPQMLRQELFRKGPRKKGIASVFVNQRSSVQEVHLPSVDAAGKHIELCFILLFMKVVFVSK